MADNYLPETVRRIARSVAATSLLLLIASSPAAAIHDTVECNPPESFGPLFQMMHDIAQLAQLAGVVLGFLGFTIGGIMILMPGQEWTRKGRTVVKTTLAGVVILLSARLVMEFLLGYFPVCT